MTDLIAEEVEGLEGGGLLNGRSSKPQPMLGRRLKALRLSRQLSLKEVAAETGVSASFLSMVETGRNEMTVGRLLAMAHFYEVSLGDLLPGGDADPPVVLRRADRRPIATKDRLVIAEALASWHRGDMVSRIVRFEVGGESERESSRNPGPEFILVLGGELTTEFADDTAVVLAEGDSIWFEASRRHRHLNSGDHELSIISFQGAIRTGQV